MNKILRKEVLTPSIKLFEVETPLIAKKVLPGQFVVTIAYEQGERIPLTVEPIPTLNNRGIYPPDKIGLFKKLDF